MAYQKSFEKSEYADRVTRTKQRMRKAGFELLLCRDPANMCYLTGFDGWSFTFSRASGWTISVPRYQNCLLSPTQALSGCAT